MNPRFFFTICLFFLFVASNKLLCNSEKDNYLIITPTLFVDDLKPLVLRKQSMGMEVFVITVEQINSVYNGRDIQEKIRNCIIQYYSNNDVFWVLLIGKPDPESNPGCDSIRIPTVLDKNWEMPVRYVYAKTQDYQGVHYFFAPSDMYYSCLDGNWDNDMDGIYGERYIDNENRIDEVDWIPDICIGRIPATNREQLIIYINKLLSVDYSNLSEEEIKALQINADINYAIREQNVQGLALANYPGYELPTLERVNSEINNGKYNIVTITGHSFQDCWSLFDDCWYGNDLNPGSPLFFCYAAACYSSDIDERTDLLTITEALLFKENAGAIGYIGAWRLSTPIGQNDFWEQFWKSFYSDGETRVGVALNNAIRYNHYAFAYWIYNWYDYFHYTPLIFNLFGDPQLQLGKINRNGPKIVSIPSPISPDLETYNYDDDNIAEAKGMGRITWKKIDGPEYFNIDSLGHISWVPDVYGGEPNNGGRPDISIEASDSNGTSFQKWEVQCMEPGKISSFPNRFGYQGKPYLYDENQCAEVSEMENVRWKIIEGPAGYKIDSVNGKISWIPSDTGEFEIVILAYTDWKLDFQRYALKVNCTPEQPSAIIGNITPCIGNSESYHIENSTGVSYQWDVTNGVVSGSGNNVNVVWNSSGTQTITVTPSNNCGNGLPRQLIVNVTESPLQIPESETANSLIIYPNPTHDKIYITNINIETVISIYTISGMKIKETTAKSREIEISIKDLQKGLYLVRFTNERTSYLFKMRKD